ncbi:MAG: response regulator [Anaerolineae bacterium]|nr:response regulator [Anaerolineae bacterium]
MSRILVVEDSPTVLYMVSRMLTDGGYQVMTAKDGEEAMTLAIKERPSLVLLDVILPKLNGYQVCRRMKSTPATAQIPVILITSKTKETDRFWGMEQGADDYVTKPFDAQQLLAVVNRFAPQVGATYGK